MKVVLQILIAAITSWGTASGYNAVKAYDLLDPTELNGENLTSGSMLVSIHPPFGGTRRGA